jgi:hypothetical protein
LRPPERRAEPRAPTLPPQALHGREARIEAATSIYVTASGDAPIHVALLSVDGRRVFARLAGEPAPGEDISATLPGRRARFALRGDGDHTFEVLPESFAVAATGG